MLIYILFYSLVDESGNVTSKIRLRDYYFIPEIVQKKDNYDHFSRGLLTQNAQDQDHTTQKKYILYLFVI